MSFLHANLYHENFHATTRNIPFLFSPKIKRTITQITKKLKKKKGQDGTSSKKIIRVDSRIVGGRIHTFSCIEKEKEKGEKKKNSRDFERAIHGQGTEPNGEWGLNYRFERILRVCTAARYKR